MTYRPTLNSPSLPTSTTSTAQNTTTPTPPASTVEVAQVSNTPQQQQTAAPTYAELRQQLSEVKQLVADFQRRLAHYQRITRLQPLPPSAGGLASPQPPQPSVPSTTVLPAPPAPEPVAPTPEPPASTTAATPLVSELIAAMQRRINPQSKPALKPKPQTSTPAASKPAPADSTGRTSPTTAAKRFVTAALKSKTDISSAPSPLTDTPVFISDTMSTRLAHFGTKLKSQASPKPQPQKKPSTLEMQSPSMQKIAKSLDLLNFEPTTPQYHYLKKSTRCATTLVGFGGKVECEEVTPYNSKEYRHKHVLYTRKK